jgi:hypothetical protein
MGLLNGNSVFQAKKPPVGKTSYRRRLVKREEEMLVVVFATMMTSTFSVF